MEEAPFKGLTTLIGKHMNTGLFVGIVLGFFLIEWLHDTFYASQYTALVAPSILAQSSFSREEM